MRWREAGNGGNVTAADIVGATPFRLVTHRSILPSDSSVTPAAPRWISMSAQQMDLKIIRMPKASFKPVIRPCPIQRVSVICIQWWTPSPERFSAFWLKVMSLCAMSCLWIWTVFLIGTLWDVKKFPRVLPDARLGVPGKERSLKDRFQELIKSLRITFEEPFKNLCAISYLWS